MNKLICHYNLKLIEPSKVYYGLKMFTANILQNMILYL